MRYLLIWIFVISLVGIAYSQSNGGDSPDVIYHLLSHDLAKGVSISMMSSAGTYLAVDSHRAPQYFQDNYSGFFALPKPDTTILHVVCAPVISSAVSKILFNQLQRRSEALYMGKYFTNYIDTVLFDELDSLISVNAHIANLAKVFEERQDTIWVLLHEKYSGSYHADASRKIVRMTQNGLNPRILLHEVGHVLSLPNHSHPCNICDDITQHIMYELLSENVEQDQIMIQDLLTIVDVCAGNAFCNSCDTPQLMATNTDTRDTLPTVMYTPHQYVRCIDCSIEDVNLKRFSPRDLKSIINELPDTQTLMIKFTQEYNHYARESDLENNAIDEYINDQVAIRRNFYLERVRKIALQILPEKRTFLNSNKFDKIQGIIDGIEKELN